MKVGDKIYCISWKRGEGYSKELKETELTQVGRTYFSTKLERHRKIEKANMGNKIISSDDHVLYFLSPKEHADFFEKSELAKQITEFLRYSKITDLPFLKTKEIHRILFT